MDFLQESIQELMDADEEQVRDLLLPEVPEGSTLEEDIEADPEKWRKFWKTLTGDAEHKRTLCMQKMRGKVTDEAAFCQTLFTKFEQTEKKEEKPVEDKKPAEEKKELVKEKTIFAPIDITILEQGDKEDEYFELAREASIRSGVHLSRAVTKAVKEALSKVEKQFDSVDVVLRRKPIEEDKPAEDKKDSKEDTKEKAECELLAACRLFEENKVKEDYLKTKAEAAVKAGTLWDRIKGLILHEPTQKIVEKTFETVQPVWPAKELDKIVGKSVVIDTIFNDRWVGKIQRDGEGRFKISMPSGEKKFSMHDVKRILIKT